LNGNHHPQHRRPVRQALLRFAGHHPVLTIASAVALVLLFPLLAAVFVHQILLPLLTPLLLIVFLVWMYRWVVRGRRSGPPHM
jgi:hypothetical protein